MPRLRSRVRDSFPAPASRGRALAIECGSPFSLDRSRFGFDRRPGRGGRVVMQRPAKPSTPVRFRPPPPEASAVKRCSRRRARSAPDRTTLTPWIPCRRERAGAVGYGAGVPGYTTDAQCADSADHARGAGAGRAQLTGSSGPDLSALRAPDHGNYDHHQQEGGQDSAEHLHDGR